MIARVARNMVWSCLAMAAVFAIWTRDLAAPLGVFGGGILIGLSFWAIRGSVDALISLRTGPPRGSGDAAETGESAGKRTRFPLVKFFTRHGILALAAYGMMVRLHLDPVGLLAGVSSLGVAVAGEALRDLRWRRFL
jgi:hypothetical protein